MEDRLGVSDEVIDVLNDVLMDVSVTDVFAVFDDISDVAVDTEGLFVKVLLFVLFVLFVLFEGVV